MSETLYVPYKSLKQKQKARIADRMYRETLCFYLEHQRMPEAEEVEQLCQSIYIKIRGGNYRVVYEEIWTLYEKRLEKYALRVQRDVEAGITLESFSKQSKQKKIGKARRPKKMKKREHEELEPWQDDRFFFIGIPRAVHRMASHGRKRVWNCAKTCLNMAWTMKANTLCIHATA